MRRNVGVCRTGYNVCTVSNCGLNSTQLKFITTLWSVDQIAQLITTHESRVHKMKNNEHEMPCTFSGKAMVITLLLASLNSCTNPWIYMAFSDHLRRRLVRCCRASLLTRSQTTAKSSSSAMSSMLTEPLPPQSSRLRRSAL